MRLTTCLIAACAAALAAGSARAQGGSEGGSGDIPPGAHVPIEVVVVTTFQIGKDTGGSPGEFAHWVADLPLPATLPFPQGYRDLRYNPDLHVLGIVSGEGPTHMAASITALANDDRFDFSHAYWLLAGIAGIDPNAGPAGSAAWANYVVDGDLAYEIDAREIPPDWTTGYVPLGRFKPYQAPRPAANSINGVNLFALNSKLAGWAYEVSRAKAVLVDDSNLQNLRAEYTSYPKTQSPPQVLRGDVLAAGTFWLGGLLDQWAEKWVSYWSQGKATFTMTSEEDAGYMQALSFLAQVHKVDLNRVMDLRGASDFSVPPPGETPAKLLESEANGTGYSGFIESLDNVYRTGSPVVRLLTSDWSYYRDHVPGGAP